MITIHAETKSVPSSALCAILTLFLAMLQLICYSVGLVLLAFLEINILGDDLISYILLGVVSASIGLYYMVAIMKAMIRSSGYFQLRWIFDKTVGSDWQSVIGQELSTPHGRLQGLEISSLLARRSQ